MSIYHVTGSSGSIAADRTPFFGYKIPMEMKSLPRTLQTNDPKTCRSLLQAAVNSLRGEPPTYKTFKKLVGKNSSEEDVTKLFSGILALLKMALRVPRATLKEEAFKQDLLELRIPENYIPEFCGVFFGPNGETLDDARVGSNPPLPKLQLLKWRVDVVISTSVLNRALEPSILIEMTLSMGEIKKFEVPLSSFHKLRYCVAQVLQEMEELEKRNILKIQS